MSSAARSISTVMLVQKCIREVRAVRQTVEACPRSVSNVVEPKRWACSGKAWIR